MGMHDRLNFFGKRKGRVPPKIGPDALAHNLEFLKCRFGR